MERDLVLRLRACDGRGGWRDAEKLFLLAENPVLPARHRVGVFAQRDLPRDFVTIVVGVRPT